MEPCLAHKLAHLRTRFTNRDFRPLKAQNWYPRSPLLTDRTRDRLGGTKTGYDLLPFLRASGRDARKHKHPSWIGSIQSRSARSLGDIRSLLWAWIRPPDGFVR